MLCWFEFNRCLAGWYYSCTVPLPPEIRLDGIALSLKYAPWIPTCAPKCACAFCRVVCTEQLPQERPRRIYNLWTCVCYDVIDLVEEAVDKSLQYTDQLQRTNPVAAPSCINLKMNVITPPPHAHTTSMRPCILQFVWTRSGLCQ